MNFFNNNIFSSFYLGIISFLEKFPAWVLVLGILVFVHELGHFLVAKLFGVGVLEFSIGFGKKLWTKKIGQTRYSLGLIPLGGYVRMVGDDPRKINQNISELIETKIESEEKPEEKKALSNYEKNLQDEEEELIKDKNKWFLKKSYLQKISIVFAGPLFNILFAIIVAFGSLMYFGKRVPQDKPIIGSVIPNLPAERSGIKADDLIVKVNNKTVSTWKEMSTLISGSPTEEINLDIKRNIDSSLINSNSQQKDISKDNIQYEDISLKLRPEIDSSDLAIIEGQTEKRLIIGIIPKFELEPSTISEASYIAAYNTFRISYLNLATIYKMIIRKISPNKVISGPIFIFQQAGDKAKKGVESLLEFMIVLSIGLAVLNLLPIPILDGGHIMFFTIEKIVGRPISIKTLEIAQQFGMLLLLILMVYAVGNDINRMINFK